MKRILEKTKGIVVVYEATDRIKIVNKLMNNTIRLDSNGYFHFYTPKNRVDTLKRIKKTSVNKLKL